MLNVLLLLNMPGGLHEPITAQLREAFPDVRFDLVTKRAEVGDRLAEAEVMVTSPYIVDDAIFRDATKLKWVQNLATGVDGIVNRPTLRPEVIVTTGRGVHREAVSETALFGMLYFARNLPAMAAAQRAHRWERAVVPLLAGATAGIYGIGVISEALAPRLKALGMRTVGFTSAPRVLAGFDEVTPRSDFSKRVGELDYLVLLSPLDETTRGVVSASILKAMKRTAILVNVGRGGLVDEPAMIEALKNGTIAGAALDVFATEPLPADSPLWDMPNVFVTSHIGGFSSRYAELFAPIVIENMRLYREGRYSEMLNRFERKPKLATA